MSIRQRYSIIERIEACDTVDELDLTVLEYSQSIGMSGYYLAYYDPTNGLDSIDHRPKEWLEHYKKQGLFAFDPVHQANFQRSGSFTWDECFEGNEKISPNQVKLLRQANDYGLRQGFNVKSEDTDYVGSVICVYSDNGRRFYDSLREHRSDIEAISNAVHIKYRTLKRPETNPLPKLAPREIECLNWVAEGKTNAETAIIMGISVNTVNRHIQNAAQKLGVHSKLHAIVKAVQLKIVSPSI